MLLSEQSVTSKYPVTTAVRKGVTYSYTYFERALPDGIYYRMADGPWLLLYTNVQEFTGAQLLAIAELRLNKERIDAKSS